MFNSPMFALDETSIESIITACSFADVGSNLMTDTKLFLKRPTTNQMSCAQASGQLNIVTGTAVNAEFLARSAESFYSPYTMRYRMLASQRIANQNLAIMLADKVGEGVSCTVLSATQVSVNLPSHGFTAKNVGQSMCLGGINGLATAIPGRYAIASVTNADKFVLTVSGFPASGSFTADLFGWNYVRFLYNGATATNVLIDTQRKGWACGDTTATCVTTASPGHIAQVRNKGREVNFANWLNTSVVNPASTPLGVKFENIPDPDCDLYLYVWAYNGSTAPASTTTFSLMFWSVETYPNVVVQLESLRMQGGEAAMPAAIVGTPTVNANATETTLVTPLTSTINSAATTNANNIKSAAGTLYGVMVSNNGASTAYVKIFNKATAPVPGTDTPIFTIAVVAGITVPVHFGRIGARLSAGIGITITGAAADLDTTAVTAGAVKVITSYI